MVASHDVRSRSDGCGVVGAVESCTQFDQTLVHRAKMEEKDFGPRL